MLIWFTLITCKWWQKYHPATRKCKRQNRVAGKFPEFLSHEENSWLTLHRDIQICKIRLPFPVMNDFRQPVRQWLTVGEKKCLDKGGVLGIALCKFCSPQGKILKFPVPSTWAITSSFCPLCCGTLQASDPAWGKCSSLVYEDIWGNLASFFFHFLKCSAAQAYNKSKHF